MIDVETTEGRRPRSVRPLPSLALTGLPVADGFELDLVGHRLRHDGRAVHLRPREYELLVALASNPGRAFTRRELIEVAWGSALGIGPRTVDVHVHWLRAKIEPEPRQPAHLVTVRGFGYRLDPPMPLTNP